MHITFKIINKCFKANLLSLNYEKMQCVQFRKKSAMQTDSKIVHGNNIISNVSHTKFLDLVIGNTLSWINQADRTVNKLEFCLFMLGSVKLLCPTHLY
jgi:hypothetical protein